MWHLIFNLCWNILFHIAIFLSDAKAAEAAQSAYYDPNRPQCAYVPPPEYYVSYVLITKYLWWYSKVYESAVLKKKQNVYFNFYLYFYS